MFNVNGLFLVFLALSPFSFAADSPEFPYVVAVGSAERDLKPDRATIRFGIMAYEQESKSALDKVNLTTRRALEILKSYGIDADAIEATDLNKSTTRNDEYEDLEILGYEVSRSLTVKLDDLSKYSEVIDNLAAEDNLIRIRSSFDISNRREIEAELVQQAGADARRNAELMCEGLGVDIHSVYAVSQISNFDSFYSKFGISRHRVFNDMPIESSHRTILFVPESINISQGINVVFRIAEYEQ